MNEFSEPKTASATPFRKKMFPHADTIPMVRSVAEHVTDQEAEQQLASTVDLPVPALRAHGIHKTYRKGKVELPVLRGVDLDVHAGEFLAIVGKSGCGKSTLLHLLGLLDKPDRGEIFLGENRIDTLPVGKRDRLRNRTFGMVFQFYHLLPELTALENVLMPLWIQDSVWSYCWNRRQRVAKAQELLETVGLGKRMNHKPREMSGGEMQRAAIARALVTEPQVLLADEPTGNLDSSNGEEILRILANLNQQRGLTIVMVTHDLGLARQADRVVRLGEGRLLSNESAPPA